MADFVQVSLDLGHEYATLGKTERAANIYASVRQCISKSNVADELRVLYFLRYSELLGTIGNVLKGLALCKPNASITLNILLVA